MKVTAIIVHWNDVAMLNQQLKKLLPTSELEVIVVDNDSIFSPTVTRSFKRLSSKKIRVIRNKKNIGFAAACNQGARIAKGEWLLFLNPDTHIATAEVLKGVSLAEARKIQAFSPMQRSDNYFKPLPTWMSLLVEFSPLRRLVPLSVFSKRTLFGGCLFIRRDLLHTVGGWDEDFFLWFEDSDLTAKIYRSGEVPGWISLNYTHVGGHSFTQLNETKKRTLFFQSMNIYANKHFGWIGRIIVKGITHLNGARI